MKRLRVCLVLLAAVAAGTGAAAGSKLEPPDPSRYLRWGPVRVRPGFAVSNLGYDDNILFSSTREKVSDYTVTLSPRLEGLVLFGDRIFVTFEEQLDYTVYFENSDQNFFNHEGATRFTLPMRKMGFFTELAWADVEWRPIDREDSRTGRDERQAAFGVILQPGWRTEIEIGRSFTDMVHDDPDPGSEIEERLNREEQATTIGVGYRVRGRTRILLDALFKSIGFDQPFAGVPRDTRERRLLGGLEFGEGGSLTGRATVGRAEIDAQDPALPDLTEIIGEIRLAYRLTARTRLALDAERLPGFSVFEGNAYYLSSQVGLRGVHYLNHFLGLEGRVAQGKLSFPESLSGSVREDELFRYEGGVRLRLARNSMGRRVEYSVTLGRYRRESTLASVEQSQTTFGVGAVLGF